MKRLNLKRLNNKYILIGAALFLSFSGGSYVLGDTLQRQATQAEESLITPTVEPSVTPTEAPEPTPTPVKIWPTYTPTPSPTSAPQWNPDTDMKKAVEDYMKAHPTPTRFIAPTGGKDEDYLQH